LTDDLHRDYYLNMSSVEIDFARLHNQALDWLGRQTLGLHGVKVEEPGATKGTLQVETATESSATEIRPPDVEKPS